MVNRIPAPTIEPDLFGGFTIHYEEETKEGTIKHNTVMPTYEAADDFYQHRLCLWAITPLVKWCNQQEHLANVQQLTYAARRDSINKLAKITRAFMALPRISAIQAAEFLSNKAIPMLQNAYPGTSSKYYAHTVNLEQYLREMQAKLTNIYLSPIIAHQKANALPSTL
jgi:hypothetical protein